ncbi:MAG: HisA/HisF-related TIM barrel protein, partial [Actinomycetota bacterium]|nr:HisA/HisF-related TIM barrel protein [Actinomycetota bacterium]
MAMEVIPAVDLSGGRVVRLLQGDYGRVTGFDETPDEAADRFSLAGASWLHVIDLDAARDGERSPEHAAVLE